MGGDTYTEVRGRLEEALAELAALAEERGSRGVAAGARSLLDKLGSERFNVVVVGEFKRGKTTFVNALLGAEILPAAVVPLTSIVTAVTWGPEVRAEVTFQDGRVETVDPSELARFVTERGNPGNRAGVVRALLHHPSEDLRGGVFLVDTPGVGSVFGHNTEAAYAFVPEADAAIFLTSADPPISATERAFLEDVRAEAARMFFVLNKVDYLSPWDREEAVAFTEGVLRETLGRPVTLYPVSAARALAAKLAGDPEALEASGLARFERDFRQFLLRERGATFLASVTASARKLAGDERNSIELEQRALRLPLDELEEASRRLEGVFEEARAARRDLSALLEKEVEQVVGMVEQDLAAFRRAETPVLLREAEAFLRGRPNLREAAVEVDRHVKSLLRRSVDRWRATEERRVGEAFSGATTRFVERTNRLVEETVRLSADVLGVSLTPVAAPGGISPDTRFTYSFFEVPTILESLLPDVQGLLPRRWGLGLVLRRVRGEVPTLVDKHCGRLRWDFVQRLERSRVALERALDERLEATIDSLRLGLRRAMEERGRAAADAERTARHTAELAARLERLEGELAALAARVTQEGKAA